MENLMNLLMSCDVSFIRCIKSNDKKLANTWYDSLTINQIRYSIIKYYKILKFI